MSLIDIDYTHGSRFSTHTEVQRITPIRHSLSIIRINRPNNEKPENVDDIRFEDGMIIVKKSVGQDKYPVLDTANYSHLPKWFRESNNFMLMYKYYRDYGKTCDRCGGKLTIEERSAKETLCYKCARVVYGNRN